MGLDPWAELREKAERVVRDAEASLGVMHPAPLQDAPEDRGLFALAVFPYAKELRKSPADVAGRIASVAVPPPFSGLAAEGGYVNFVADPGAFASYVLAAVASAGEGYGRSEPVPERILLEHTSTNPTGPMHVGRARNPIYADALARILRLAGHTVTREYLVNDVGRQMVVQYWGSLHLRPEEVGAPDQDKDDYRYVKYYQVANARFEQDADVRKEIESLIQRFERGDVELTKDIRKVGETVLHGILQSLVRLGVTFDSFAWESDWLLDGSVKRVIDRLMPLSLEEDGAHYLDLAAFGLEGEAAKYFFVRKDGTSLYTTRDIAYHLRKMERCDRAINVLGEDQKLSFQRLKAAFRLMGIDWAPETIFYSFVNLPEGRMSTRKGRVVNLDDLMDEALARAYDEVAKRRADLPEDRKRAIAEAIGIGAVRYNIARVQAEKVITFRWEEALAFEGNAAPFLQYAHARTCGILAKAPAHGAADATLLVHPQEQRLLRGVARFPTAVRDAAVARRVHAVAGFAADFAAQFNQFYRDCPVLTADTPMLRDARLALVDAARAVLRNVLDVLGIQAPDEM